jgi:hypothetical protein
LANLPPSGFLCEREWRSVHENDSFGVSQLEG